MSRCPICQLEIPARMLLCLTHWSLVPFPLREPVQYFARTRKGGPSHRKACRQAIDAVEKILEARQKEIEAKAAPKPVRETTLPYRDD